MVSIYGLLILLLTSSLAVLLTAGKIKADATPQFFNVLDFGAVGNGETDDTHALLDAWASTCTATKGVPATMIIPRGKTFLVMPTIFKGPCKSKAIHVQVEGILVAPENPRRWKGRDASLWLEFEWVDGLTVDGFGHINGRGSKWWHQSCKTKPRQGCTTVAPTALKFIRCNDLVVRNVKFIDSQQRHLVIMGCHRVNIADLAIAAPASSPNTDGIHIHSSHHVIVKHTSIATGDDCISIGDDVYDVTIRDISCGPGHGISIGSLGEGGTRASVEEVHVARIHMYGTTNGARIKTWQGGQGVVKSVSFKNINFTNVANPIIIDQYYCDLPDRQYCPPQPQGAAVEITNVSYASLFGTSSTQVAITLNCSRSVSCTGIHLDNVALKAASPGPPDVQASCINAHGYTAGYMHPPVPCLLAPSAHYYNIFT